MSDCKSYKKILTCAYFFLFCWMGHLLPAQLQQAKWYFGGQAALDFMSNPPTPLLNSAMNSNYGCASTADAAGNLLFYTDGLTVYNAAHLVMANGTGLLGIGSPVQPCLIVQQPGSSNLHYIFTVVGNGNPGGLNYSIVDMSLAAGLGSVIVTNASLYAPAVDEKISGTTHCNGTDIWIVVHENFSSNFRSYLLTASGINTTAVVSKVGPISTNFATMMKISPSGNKLATVNRPPPGTQPQDMELYDFDNTSGLLSNYQSLYTGLQIVTASGLEFSPDGSKLYCGERTFGNITYIYQWNLCAGSLPAIISSHYSVSTTPVLGAFQLALNGKIYIAEAIITGTNTLGVINTPNNSGALCNYVPFSQTLGTKNSTASLPNFITHYKSVLMPFSYSLAPGLACHAMSFTANLPAVNCASSNYAVDSLRWNFGDVATGTLNVANTPNPVHFFSASGNFTTTLIFYYKCSSDTLRQTVYLPPPNLAVSTASNCSGLASATAVVTGGIGPYSYTWLPGTQTNSVASNLSPGVYTLTINDPGLNCSISSVISIAPITAPLMSLTPKGNLAVCSGSTVNVYISGNMSTFSGAGIAITGNTVSISPTSSQIYTITGFLNACAKSTTLQVNVLPLPTPSISVNSQTLCVNSVLELKGSGGDTYRWSGPLAFSSSQQQVATVLNSASAAGLYNLTVTDLNGCSGTAVISIAVGQLPVGELKGLRSQGCVPLCASYRFEKQNQQTAVVSLWEIGGLSFGDQFTHCFTTAGSFVINGTLSDTLSGCVKKITYLIDVEARPKADFVYRPDNPVTDLDEVTFINTSTGDNQFLWSWSFNTIGGAALRNSSGKMVTNRFYQAGTHLAALVVRNTQGCVDTVIKTIVVSDRFTLFVPNTFTPNGDLLNDVFLPVARGLNTYSLKIFNRWGALIFESNDPAQGWDGNYHGEAAQDGNYIWQISYSGHGNQHGLRNGEVLLRR